MLVDEAIDGAIETAWRRVLAEWEDERAHEAFVMLAASADRLADAGRRYREIREEDASRAARADAQIERVLAVAMLRLEALKTERAPRSAKTKVFLLALGMSGAMIASAIWALLRMS